MSTSRLNRHLFKLNLPTGRRTTWTGSRLLKSRSAVGALLVVATALFALAAGAAAKVSVSLHKYAGTRSGRVIKFHVKGLKNAKIQWGRLEFAGGSIKISLAQLRSAAKGGTLKVRAPKGHHRLGHPVLVIATAKQKPAKTVKAPAHASSPSTATLAAKGPKSAVSAATTTSGTPSATPPGIAMPAIPSTAKYVSASGSDSNPGTSAQPWKTVAKAVSAATPGDTVVFKAGTYGARGTRTNWTAAGTSTAPINFIGDPTASARRSLATTSSPAPMSGSGTCSSTAPPARSTLRPAATPMAKK